MKTWEMIKELTENPNKRFRSLTDSSRREERKIAKSDGKVLIHINDGSRLVVYLNEEWEEVKQPVSFMEAVASGKKIKAKGFVQTVKMENVSRFQSYLSLEGFLKELTNTFSSYHIRQVLTDCEFYIED